MKTKNLTKQQQEELEKLEPTPGLSNISMKNLRKILKEFLNNGENFLEM